MSRLQCLTAEERAALGAEVATLHQLAVDVAGSVEAAYARSAAIDARRAVRALAHVHARLGARCVEPRRILPEFARAPNWLSVEQHHALGTAIAELVDAMDPPGVHAAQCLGSRVGRAFGARYCDHVLAAMRALDRARCRLDTLFAREHRATGAYSSALYMTGGAFGPREEWSPPPVSWTQWREERGQA